MSLYLPTTDAQISNAFLATLNAAPGATYLAQAKSLGVAASAQVLINATGKTTAATLATQLVSNLGITGTAATTAESYLVTQINAAGGVSKFGSGLITALDLFAGLTNDATFGTFATTYVNKVNSSVTYSNVSTNTSTDLTVLASAVSSTGATAGSTFTLTTAADEFLPTSSGTAKTTNSDDTFNAGAGRLNTNDNLDGGSGNDTLNATLDAAVAPVIKNVETLNLTMRGGSIDLIDVSGETTVNVLGNQSGGVFGNSANATVNLTEGFSLGSSEALELRLEQDSSTADQITVVSKNASAFTLQLSGIETLNLKADSVLILGGTALQTSTEFSGLNTINVSGTANATINFGTAGLGGASGVSALSAIDGSALLGNLSLTMLEENALKVVGGAGNDTINLGSALDTLDTINGGAGSDTVRGSVDQALSNVRPTLIDVETLQLDSYTAAGTLDLSRASGLSTLQFAGTANVTVTNIGTALDTVRIVSGTTDQDYSFTYAGSNTGVTITVGTIGTATGGMAIGDIAVGSNTGTLSINFGGISANTMSAISANGVNSLRISATQDIGMSLIRAQAADSVTIELAGGADFSAASADFGGATSINIISTGTANFNLNDMVVAGGAQINISAVGDVTLSALQFRGVASAASSVQGDVNLSIGSGATATISAIQLGSAATANSVRFDLVGSGNVTLNFNDASASGGAAGAYTAFIDSVSLGGSLSLFASAVGTALMSGQGGGTAVVFNVQLGNGSGNVVSLGALADTVVGGATGDTIQGGGGADQLAGGGGADVFVYITDTTGETGNAAVTDDDGADVITDFSTADVIRFVNISARNSANFGSAIVAGETAVALLLTATLSGTVITSANLGVVAVFQRASDVVIQVAVGTAAAGVENNLVEIVLQGESFNTAFTSTNVVFTNSALEFQNIVMS